MKISTCAQEIKPSSIRKMFNKALQYDHVISFTLGEPDFTASENVAEEGCRAIREGKSKYSANAGILPLREAIRDRLRGELGVEYDPDTEITVTVGAMGALYLTLKTLLDPGDEVIICEPFWTNYLQQVKMSGGVPVLVACREENDFIVDLNELRQAVTPKTRAILLNSPANPTGGILDRRTLEEIAALAQEKDLIVLSDEVYKTIVFDGAKAESIASLSGMKERTVVINSFSKGYAMTGWRVGYAAGPREIIGNVTKFQENVVACAAMPAQYAALEALNGPQDYNAYMVEQYKARRDLLMERIAGIPGMSCRTPKGTFYAFVNIRGLGMTSEEFANRLLESKQVVVVPGTAFGEKGEGYIRISYAASREEITEGMDRIEAFVKELGQGC